MGKVIDFFTGKPKKTQKELEDYKAKVVAQGANPNHPALRDIAASNVVSHVQFGKKN